MTQRYCYFEDHIYTDFTLSIRFFHAYAFPEGNSA